MELKEFIEKYGQVEFEFFNWYKNTAIYKAEKEKLTATLITDYRTDLNKLETLNSLDGEGELIEVRQD